jgi:cytochrome b subunit of formate dehydrogenase
MDKTKLLYIVNAVLGVSFLVLLVTGIIKFPGLLPALGVKYSSLPMRQISTVHDWSGILMGASAVVHIMLNWNWIVLMTKKHLGLQKTKETVEKKKADDGKEESDDKKESEKDE